MTSRNSVLKEAKESLGFPVVLVPGDGGSQAFGRHLTSGSVSLLWLSLAHLLLPRNLSPLKLFYNATTGINTDAEGYRIEFPGWGDTRNIENLNTWGHRKTAYFEDLVASLLENKFYIRNHTLRGAPYDFRKAPYENDHFMHNFPQLIHDTFVRSGNLRVVIVAYSLGSLYVLHFLKNMDQIWKRTYIKSFVATSAPIGGSIKALLLEISGSSFGMPVNPLPFRDIERSFTSTAYLLPRPSRFSESQIIVKTKEKNYTVSDYYQLFKDMGFKKGYHMYLSSMEYFDANDALEGIPDIHCIHGINIQTPKLLKYPSIFPDAYPWIEYGDGDGTVNVNSLHGCKSWKGVKHVQIKNVNHKDVLTDPRFIAYVKALSVMKPSSKL